MFGNPTGGVVVAGSATIGSAGKTLNINQSTQNAIISWQQFSIASGELTKFLVPNASSATLNRVLGGNPSAIYGTLQSNGILYLVNPSGIVVGPGGVINTAGFMASTLDVSNEQFLAGGNLSFTGASNASIDNEGVINASSGGVYLIANQVTNNGTISAPQGDVGLAAGSNVLFQPVGAQHLFIQSNPVGTTQAVGVTNSGTVQAATAELRAAGGNAYALAINNTGVIAATGYKKVNGQVYLTAVGGNITNSGRISATNPNGNGGTIVVDGSGTSPTGGTVLNSGTLNASSTVAGGSGGSVTLKNMGGTTVHSGKILAKGGQGGAGGNAEISGGVVQFTGTVDLTAPGGTTGNLLFDPYNVIIQDGDTSTTVASGSPTDTFTGDVTNSILTVGDLETALASANITVTTGGSGSPGSDGGDITVVNPVSWSADTNLTLSAYRNINVSASVTNSNETGGGNVTLRADNSGTGTGTVTFTNEAQISTGGNVTIFFNPSVNPAGSAVNGSSYVSPTEDFTSDVNLTGSGALTAYMLVNTLNDLQNVQNNPGGTYALGGNIDATSTATWNGGSGFVPIGNGGTSFTGTFNGQGYTINGLYINAPNTQYTGLFGYADSGSILENVGVTNVQVSGSTVGSEFVGGLLGWNNGGTVESCYATGQVSLGSNSGLVGGLVGYNASGTVETSYATVAVSGPSVVGGLVGQNDGTLETSYANGAVTGVGNTGTGEIGGLVGQNDGTLETSYATGPVTGSSGSVEVGGLVANNTPGGTVEMSYATGVVTSVNGSVYVGGLAGTSSGAISNSFWDTSTSGLATGVGIDYGTSTNVIGSTTTSGTNNLLTLATYSGAGWDIGTDPTSNTWVILDGQTRPMLAMEYSTTITNAHQLQLMDLNLSANYTLANNIDLSGTTNASDVWGTSTTNGGAGFVPIANDPTYDGTGPNFSGTFNGQDYTINGLYINTPGVSTVGLFGVTGPGSLVENVGLTNVQVSGYELVGGLVGDNFSGTVETSYATGTVNGTDFVGGLVGVNGGDAGTVETSYANATVSGSNYIGGLVGVVNGGSTVETSYATGTVSGSQNVGGLVGLNNFGTISNAYSTASVSGSGNNVGGLVGQNEGAISNAYTTGAVTAASGSNSVGGLVGYNYPGTITNSHSTGVVITGSGSHEVGGLVGANQSSTISTSYSTGAVIAGNTSTYVGGLVGWNYQGTISDAYNTGAISGGNYVGGLVGFSNSGPISNSSNTGTISGSDYVGGLVGDIVSGPISNSSNAGAVSGTIFLGGLVGYDNSSPISNSSNTGAVIAGAGSNWVGGLVGWNYWTITNSYSTGAVIAGDGSTGVGGLVGWNQSSGTIDTSYSSGAVTAGAGSSGVGGLVGQNNNSITNASTTGVVTAGAGSIDVGGLVGANYSAIGTSYSTGAVIGSNSVGGLVGYNDGSIDNSFSTAVVTSFGTGNTYVGGLVGENYVGVINNSYSTGTVTGSGSFFVGGLAGGNANTGVVSNSYSTGMVIGGLGSSDVGGLVGLNSGSTIKYAYSTGAVSGTTYLGGLVGVNDAGTILDTYSSGAVSGGSSVGGLAGFNNATISASFWDTTTSGTNVGVGFPFGGSVTNVFGLTTPDMISASTYAGTNHSSLGAVVTLNSDGTSNSPVGPNNIDISFSPGGWNIGQDPTPITGNTWVILDGQTRPMLAGEYSTTITNAHQLQLIALNPTTLSASYTLANNIDLSGTTNPSDVWGTSTGNGGGGFVPIGSDPNYGTGPNFTGTFDGQGHTINNLYINTPGASYVSLFGEAGSGALIENVGMTNVQVSGGTWVGGLVGASYGAITNSYTSGTVRGVGGVGGLAGFAHGTINDDSSAANVTDYNYGTACMGGLVGDNYGSTITNSSTTGTVTASAANSSDVGGLVGLNANDATLNNDYSTATVNSGGANVGGLVGDNSFGTISTSYSTGMVSGSTEVGGLVGLNDSSGTINASFSTGTVSGSTEVGGLVGYNTGTVQTSYATGTLSGSTDVGGLAGENSGTVETSYATGAVSGFESVGGLVGFNSSTVETSYATGAVGGNAGTGEGVGGLVGENDGTVQMSYATGAVTVNVNYSDVGGLVGYNGGTVETSYAAGAVQAGSYTEYVGGLVGYNDSDGTVETSYATGSVNGTWTDFGGLVGENLGSISDAYSTGEVNGGSDVGGLVGSNTSSGTISNSFWDTTTSNTTTGLGSYIADSNSVSNVFGLTTPDLLNISTYQGTNTSSAGPVVTVNSDGSPGPTLAQGSSITLSSPWSIGTDLSDTWVIFNNQTRPMLSMEYSTTITNAHQLQLIGLNSTTLGASYILANDIDLSGTTNPSDVWGTSFSIDGSGGGGFVPIGNNSETGFTGTFNGQGHTINNLFINLPSTNFVGLFGIISSATVGNVGVTNVQIVGNSQVGALVGWNQSGTISNAYSTGAVTGGTGGNAVGGLVGANDSTLNNAYSTAAVTGGSGSYEVGGLVGFNFIGVTISNSYSTGTVTGGSGGIQTGGLVGENYGGTITNSYSTGAVSGSGDDTGGLVGWNDSAGTISNSYSTGTVSGINYVGGLVGYLNGGTISNAFSTGPVSGSQYLGGLVGNVASGAISNVYSTGSVTGDNGSYYVGGLVGNLSSGTIGNAYSTGAVSGSNYVGGFAGTSSGTISNSFWDTDTAGAWPSVGAGSSTGMTGATTAQLMTQGYILANSPTVPTWDFTNVWTTNGDTTLPQLIVQPVTLTGTAYSDSGFTISPNVGVNLISGGNLLDPSYADSSGNFFFTVSSSLLHGGSLLTDATDNGNTYYQANSPASTISGIDLWGDTLRVLADPASNTALGNAAGGLSGLGINYTVSNANLTTNPGVSMAILSGVYTLDGNITASGTLSISGNAFLTGGGTGATLTGSSVVLNGGFNLTGSLAITSTAGEIDFYNVSAGEGPATAQGITLRAAGAVHLNNSYLATGGADFSATGNGYTSLVDSNGDSNGIDIESSYIDAQGGNISLTGNAGYSVPNEGFVAFGSGGGDSGNLSAGSGVLIGDGSVIQTSGNGNVTILATYNQNITSQTAIQAFDMYGYNNTISVASGAISIVGNVVQGTAAGTGENQASVGGIEIGGGAAIQATGYGGSISLTGYVPAADSVISNTDSYTNFSFSSGIEIGGAEDGPNALSVASGGSITLNGAGGTVDTSNSTLTGYGIPFTTGVIIDNGAQIAAGPYSTMTITGTGGAVITTGEFTGNSAGVIFNGNSESLFMDVGSALAITGFGGAVNAGYDPNGDGEADGVDLGDGGGGSYITVLDGGSINITGTGGSIDTSSATAYYDSIPGAMGINLQTGTDIEAYGITTITLNGTGGTVNAGEGQTGAAAGVVIGTDQDEGSTLVSSETGAIQITGTGGSTPSLGTGVVVYGFNGGTTTVQSTSGGSITITGTGGSGYNGSSFVSDNSVPNYGVAIVDNATLTTGGSISLTGTGGSNSYGVSIQELINDTYDPTLDTSPVSPVISAGGAFTATALSGTGISINNASVTAASATLGTETSAGDPTTITSGPLTIQDSTITLLGGDFIAFGSGYEGSDADDDTGNDNPDGIDIFGSTIDATANGTNISLTGTGGYFFSESVGPDEGGLIGGSGVVIGSDGNNTLIETSGTGNITITGTFNQNITTYGGLSGVAILGDSDEEGTTTTISVAQGTLTITGTVDQATFGDGNSEQTGQGGFTGVYIGGGSLIEALDSGSVSITGDTSGITDDTTGSTAYDNFYEGSSQNEGIVIAGNSSPNTIVSVGTNGTLTLNGTGGTIDSTYASDFDNTGYATGLDIGTATQITGGSGATLSLTGTGGSAITNDGGEAESGTSFTGSAEGVNIGDNNGPGGIAQVTVGAEDLNGGGITITGTGGSMDISNESAPPPHEDPDVEGVSIHDGTTVTANGAATILIQGAGGSVTAGSNAFGSAIAVDIGVDKSDANTVVSSESGLITITGNVGTTPNPAPNLAIGVVVNGFDGGTAEVESTSGDIDITGIGGNGYNGTGSPVGEYIPNYGVAIIDAATITTGGSISLTGTGGGNGSGGSNSGGVGVVELTDTTVDPLPALPTITAGGTFAATALSSTGVYLNASVTANTVNLGTASSLTPLTITSGNLQIVNSSITLTGESPGALTAYGAGTANLGSVNTDGIDIIGSTINSQGGDISLSGQASYVDPIIIVPSNMAGEGVLISDTSTIETASNLQPDILTGNITIFGDGTEGTTLAPVTVANSLIGVDINASTVSVADGALSITGQVTAGISNGVNNTTNSDGTNGVHIHNGSIIEATGTGAGGGSVAIVGDTSGAVSNVFSNLSSGNNIGVNIGGAGTTVSAADGTTGISITGTGGTITNNQTTSTSTDGYESNGIHVHKGASITATGTAPITLIGSIGVGDTNTSVNGQNVGSSIGVLIEGNSEDPSPNTQISSASGAISITGTAGSSANAGVGLVVIGQNGGTASITSGSGNITLTGTGGAGNTGVAATAGVSSPNGGLGILDGATVQSTSGDLAFNGTAGAGDPVALGVRVSPFVSGDITSGTSPVVDAGSGTLGVTSTAGGIDYNAVGALDVPTLASSATFSSPDFVTIDGAISNISGLFLIEAPVITLNAAITANDGNVVLVDTNQFVNTDGANALSSSNGHTWQVWSVNPPASGQSTVDVDDGLTPNFIQYNATYGTTTPAASGNGLLYSYAPSPLTVTLSGTFTKQYDGNENLPIAAGSYTYTASGQLSSDSISTSNSTALSGTLNSPDVDTANTVTVTPGGFSFSANQGGIPVYGYSLSGGSLSASATVTPLGITVSAVNLTGTSSIYGNTPAFANNGQSQMLNADILGGTATYSNTDALSAAGYLDAGTYNYTPSITGYNSNYTITGYTSAAFKINPLGITVAAVDLTGTPSIYGGATPVFTNNGASQVLGGDTLGGTATYANTDALSAAGYLNAGTYNYTPSITGYNSNYTITGYTSAAFKINPLGITVSAVDLTATPSIYGSTPAFANNGQSQVLASDTLGGTATYTNTDALSAAGDLNAGTYNYTPSITGYNSNYTITGYISAGFKINPLGITVSAVNLTGTPSTYGGAAPAFANNGASQMLGADALGGTATYTNTDALSGAGDLDAGTYNYTPSITGYNSNYTITGYTPAPFTISRLTLTASLTGTVTKTYDGTPAVTGTINVLLPNVLNGDSVSVGGGTATYNTPDVGTNETITASGLTLTGSDAGNYQLNPAISPANIGTITVAPLTITADDATSIQGAPLPTFTATYSGFVPVDSPSSLTGTLLLQTPANSSSPVGGYSITPSGVSDPNYQITFVPGTLTIGTGSSGPPPPSTTTGGADGGGSDIVPVDLTPTTQQTSTESFTSTGNGTFVSGTSGNPPPPVGYTGTGTSSQTGDQGGGLANSSSAGGSVASGDTVQVNGGGVNNVTNPQAAGALNQALSPATQQSLANAINWVTLTDTDAPGASGDTAAAGDDGGQETILSGGDVAEIGKKGVKKIAPDQAPSQLQVAMNGDVLNGTPSGAGH